MITNTGDKIVTDWKYLDDEKSIRMRVIINWNDKCYNGHKTFSLTGEKYGKNYNKWEFEEGGCLHDDIRKYFPEYKHLIKYHSMTAKGPIHYLENTLHFAGEKDCWGLKKGEARLFNQVLKFKDFPITIKYNDGFIKWISQNTLRNEKIIEVESKSKSYGSNFTLQGYDVEWSLCPFKTYMEAEEFLEAINKFDFEIVRVPILFSEGKQRELDSARISAVWPDATDEQLMLPTQELKAILIERLPSLIEAFKKDIKALGFTF